MLDMHLAEIYFNIDIFFDNFRMEFFLEVYLTNYNHMQFVGPVTFFSTISANS